MIHSGAVVAAGVSQGRSTSLKRDFKVSMSSEFLYMVKLTLDYKNIVPFNCRDFVIHLFQ